MSLSLPPGLPWKMFKIGTETNARNTNGWAKLLCTNQERVSRKRPHFGEFSVEPWHSRRKSRPRRACMSAGGAAGGDLHPAEWQWCVGSAKPLNSCSHLILDET